MLLSRLLRAGPSLITASIVALAGLHVVLDDDQLVSELVEASIPLLLGSGVVFVAVRLSRESFDDESILSILLGSVGAGTAVTVLALVYVVSRRYTGDPVSEGWLMLSLGWSIGTSSGAVAVYYVERVREERREQELLNGRLTVLQRVLRHNIRNEVTIIRGLNEMARAEIADSEADAALEQVDTHTARVHSLAEKANTLANLWNDPTPIESDLVSIVRTEVAHLRERYPEVSVDVTAPETAPALVHPSVGCAVHEVLDNAVTHNDPASLSIAVDVTRSGDWVDLELVDDGSSIPPDETAALAEARELPLQHGSGLGLWIVHSVVELSDGDLVVENCDPRGVRVRMRFPATDSP